MQSVPWPSTRSINRSMDLWPILANSPASAFLLFPQLTAGCGLGRRRGGSARMSVAPSCCWVGSKCPDGKLKPAVGCHGWNKQNKARLRGSRGRAALHGRCSCDP